LEDWKKPFSPLSYYIFTNTDTIGHLYVNNKSTINQKYHWSTNIEEGVEGFYANDETNISKKNREAKYKDGLHWLYVYATNFPTTDINDAEHVGIDSVPVILDNYYPSIDTVEGNDTRIIIDGSIQDFPSDRSYKVKDSSIIEMIIRFSEEMDTSRYWGEMRYWDMFNYNRDTTYFKLEGIV